MHSFQETDGQLANCAIHISLSFVFAFICIIGETTILFIIVSKACRVMGVYLGANPSDFAPIHDALAPVA